MQLDAKKTCLPMMRMCDQESLPNRYSAL